MILYLKLQNIVRIAGQLIFVRYAMLAVMIRKGLILNIGTIHVELRDSIWRTI